MGYPFGLLRQMRANGALVDRVGARVIYIVDDNGAQFVHALAEHRHVYALHAHDHVLGAAECREPLAAADREQGRNYQRGFVK